ncbi:TIGR03086 family protein [Actinomadura craniellae]|uniref:TIGR03086 family protein n=1 Tax=Actinomadura craniellae TaxID=2231787 RepID=A0A365HA82_9ACTN|nr:TIGR03086 family metal-binding protein [Actinomadura craniellae]RAY16054.1 TIGR03086 family protein [Actinomadura craniellae]
MELRPMMTPAAEAVLEVVAGVDSDRMGGRTPCADYDVRALINHLIHWTGTRAEAAARKGPYPDGPEEGHDHTAEPGWAARYAEQVRAAVRAWDDPAAWTGETNLSGGDVTMPARFTAGMLFAEWLLHGWDLAVATGQKLSLDDETARALRQEVAGMAEMGREYEIFGPEVPVPAGAPPLDRALGLAGRDPAWRP